MSAFSTSNGPIRYLEEEEEAGITAPPAEEATLALCYFLTAQVYEPGGYDDVVSSAHKPEAPVPVHHSSVPCDVKIPSYGGGGLLWVVLGIEEDVGDPCSQNGKGGVAPTKGQVHCTLKLKRIFTERWYLE